MDFRRSDGSYCKKRGEKVKLWYLCAMAPRKNPQSTSGKFVLGRARLEKTSAVEGIVTEPETKRMFARFERDGLTADQRRKAIFKKYARKA